MVEGSSGVHAEVFPIVFSICCIVLVLLVSIYAIGIIIQSSRDHSQVRRGGLEFRSLSVLWKSAKNFSVILQDPSDEVDLGDGSITLMAWKNVSCTYEKRHSDPVTTLFDNFGSLNEGEMTAVMGPSGAAKSTLLDILAGRKSVGSVSGHFSVAGIDLYPSKCGIHQLSVAIRDVSAYIPQQESFYPMQTVEEAVLFANCMKFGRGVGNDQLLFAHSCLDAVGLDPLEFSHRRIGGELASGLVIRGLSGGERKRLALACALALRPKILFADEITSGLDSVNSVAVIERLKRLSKKQHVASLVVIHQPSAEIFSCFDRLILLSRGRCLFSGLITDLPKFYTRNYNETPNQLQNLAEDLIEKASDYDTCLELEYKGESDLSLVTVPFNRDGERPLSTSSNWYKLLKVFQRSLVNHYVRNLSNVAARVVCYALMSLICGVVFWKVGENLDVFDERTARLVIGVTTFTMNVAYLLPFCSISVFMADKKFFAADLEVGLYSAGMYAATQLFLEFVVLCFASILCCAILVPMCVLRNPLLTEWESFLSLMSIIIMSGVVGNVVVFCFSMMSPTQDVAFLLGSGYVTTGLALSGGFIPPSDMKVIPYGLSWIMPVKYSLQSTLKSLFSGSVEYETLLDLAEYNQPDSVTANVLVLVLMFLLFAISSCLLMTRIREVR